ncbi:MAG TPA: hypothetical protein DEA90_09875 [Opitutae bacterium]|nr:hypothetical protein [Puniceicoccaceae bacterium]HBR94459.1 hypothetical protein [Opitutae bacterium]|tara:strand:- start:4530 stop:5204 length:675 start_codon:yes stop_codon:yes gene_type:complete
MPRTRSRPKTEEKFQNAVLKLVADAGCSALGINAVANLAGADKVLIYRYFGNFNGLLQLVAESRQWLPSADELFHSLPLNSPERCEPLAVLHKISDHLVQHVQADKCTHQLVRWRRTRACPLCLRFSEEWHQLWKELSTQLATHSSTSNTQQRQQWSHACTLLAFTVEAQLCDEPLDHDCLETLAYGLESLDQLPELENLQKLNTHEDVRPPQLMEESLPTNLL